MDLPRVGWELVLWIGVPLALLAPAAIGAYYGVPLTGLLVGFLLFLAFIGWALVRRGSDSGFGRDELLDALTDEDTEPRSAKELVSEEEPELEKPIRDPTTWDR